jgi:sugar transferase (PEP-CTERM/EpsH1 system associated)
MREILFLSHRIPFPPDRGDKIRSHHLLKRLARLAPVHVATFADDDFDAAEEADLAAVASTYKLVRRSRSLVLAGAVALLRGQPVSLPAFHDREIEAYVADVLATRSISAIYVFSGQMGQYIPADYKGRVVMDFVDVDSAKFDAYASRSGSILNWIYAREGRLLSAEEARLAERADASLLISEQEAQLFRDRLPAGSKAGDKVEVLGNGIDSMNFDPSLVGPETRMLDCSGPRLIFTGQMDYAPNIEAVLRLVDRIMPRVRERFGDATLHVVGRNPVVELLERDGIDGCHVWGRVDDIRTWLKAADMAVIPLEVARGVQNKVLEAMAMALPVVLTRDAATGIAASDGHHFRIADSDDEIIAAIFSLLTDGRRARVKGVAARRYVVANASWQSALAPLPLIIGWATRPYRDAA